MTAPSTRVARVFAWSALVVAALSCAHAPAPPADTVRPVWPPPPARARVRWVAAFPNPSTPGTPSASFWRRAFDFITGEDPDPEASRPPLVRPFGLAAAEGHLLVADPDARRVLRIRWRTGDVEALACAERAWVMPLAVAAAPDGAIWVADGGAGAVFRRDRSGHCRILGEGTFVRPSGIALAGALAYVVDPPSHAIWRLTSDGTVIGRVGARGTGNGQFNFPTGVAALADGSVLVVDSLNFRVVRISPDGNVLASFGEAGDSGGAFARPKAVAVDEAGTIYVSDAQNDVVQIYSGAGGFELAIGGSGQGPGQLSLPAGLVVSEGYLFVADSYNRRIGIFELLGGPR